MKSIRLMLLGLLCTASACYERHTEPREPFTLSGHVSDCTTGRPIEGAAIYIEASEKPSMGFFGITKSDGGNGVTDANGDFAIIPYAYSWTYEYNITAIKEGFNSDGVTAYKEDIQASGARVFSVDSLCLNQ